MSPAAYSWAYLMRLLFGIAIEKLYLFDAMLKTTCEKHE